MSLHRFFSVLSLFVFSFSPLINGVIKADEIRDYYAEPGLQPYNFARSDSFNEEISPFSGTLQIKHTDLVIPGNGGLDLVINRVYTSLQDVEMPSRSVNGFGWTMHFGRVVIPKDFAANACFNDHTDTSDNPSVEWPDGGREILAYSSVIANGTTMVTRSNARAVCLQVPGGGFLVTTPDGTQYTMDQRSNDKGETSWLTTRIEDIHGNALTISYESQDVLFYPVSISRDSEVLVSFSYVGSLNSLRLDTMTAQGRVWRYNYEPIDNNYIYPVYQLTEVERPDGKSWQYRYNGKQPDPDPADGVHEEYGPGSFSLNGLTYPYGATLDYTYQSIQFDPGSARKTWAIATKNLAGNDISNGTWTYAFSPRSRLLVLPEGDFHLDETIITTPENRLVYAHYGKDRVGNLYFSPYQIGLVYEQETRSLGGSVLESRRYAWRERIISNEDFYHGSSFYRDNHVSVADLDSEYVVRDGEPFLVDYEDFDAFGHPQTVTESSSTTAISQRITTYTFQNDTAQWILGLPLTETLSGIGTITRSYFANGKLDEEDRYGVTTRYTWYPQGDLETVRNANGNTTRYSNYKCGIAQRDDLPEGVIITRSVNDTGTVASITNGRFKTTTYSYDDLNRLQSINFPTGNSVSISYLQKSRTLSRGVYQQVDDFDSLGRITRTSRRDNQRGYNIDVTTSYDALNRITFRSDPGNAQGTSFNLDALGRVTNGSHFDGTDIGYNYDGAYIYVTDQEERTTEYLYQFYGTSFDAKTIAQIIQPEEVLTQIRRNHLGLVTSVYQGEMGLGGYTRTYNYDGRHFLMSEVNPELAQIAYGRDNVGNMTSRRVGTGATTIYTYDDLNRLTFINYPSSADVTYTYTGTNKVESVSNSSSQRTYTYDDNDNLTSESIVVDGLTYAIGYGIDSLDHISSITYPSGRTVNYAPDAYGRATQALPYVTAASYYPSGHLQSMTYANGQVTTVELTPRLWIDTIRSAGPETVMDLDYGYDDVGNVRSISNQINSGLNRSFGYDDINRLISATGSWGSKDYSYTAWGNILTSDQGIHAYNNSTMLLSSIDDPTTSHLDTWFAYDARGNISRMDSTNGNIGDRYLYTYNDASELLTTQKYTGNTLSTTKNYRYDGHNNRVRSEEASDVSRFLYSFAGMFMGEYSGSSIAEGKEYIYLAKQQVAAVKPNALPQANAGEDFIATLADNTITLDGTASSDADGNITGYQWVQLQGTTVTLINASTSTPQFNPTGLPPREVLQFGLLVTDSSGDTSVQDSVKVIVAEAGFNASADNDRDFIPNGYELLNDLNPEDASDGILDLDGDGFSNRQEFLAGFNPADPGSAPGEGDAIWSMNGDFYGSPAIASDGTIYIGSWSGQFYALKPDNTVKWQVNLVGSIGGSNAVVGVDQAVYVATSSHVYAFNSDGSIKWPELSTGATSNLLLGEGNQLYFARGQNIYAIDTVTGSELWAFPARNVFHMSIALDNTLYATALDGTVDAINLKDQSLKWRYFVGSAIDTGYGHGRPAIGADGTIYFTHSNAGSPLRGGLTALGANGKYKWTYTYSSDGFISGAAPVVGSDGTIFISHLGKDLVAVNPDGSLKWDKRLSSSARISRAPVLTRDGSVLMGEYAYDADSGVFRGRWTEELSSLSQNAPLVGEDGSVYIVADYTLLVLASRFGGLAEAPWPIPGHDQFMGGNQCRSSATSYHSVTGDSDDDSIPDCVEVINGLNINDATDAENDLDGDTLSNLEEYQAGTHMRRDDSDFDGILDQQEVMEGTSPTEPDSDQDGLSDSREIALGLNPLDSADRGTINDETGFSYRQEALWFNVQEWGPGNIADGDSDGIVMHSREAVNFSPAMDEEGLIYYPQGDHLVCIYPNGSSKWMTKLGGAPYANVHDASPVISSDGTVYIVSSFGVVNAVNPDGTIKWTNSLGENVSAMPAIGADGTLYVGTLNGNIFALHPDTGNSQWPGSFSTVGAIYSNIVVNVDGTIFVVSDVVAGDRTIFAIQPSGALYWTAAFTNGAVIFNTVSAGPAIGADGVVYVSEGQYMHALHPDTGAALWTTPYNTEEYIFASPVIAEDGTIYIAADQSLHAVNPDGSARWLTPPVLQGTPRFLNTPAIGADGTIYLGARLGGFRAYGSNGDLLWEYPNFGFMDFLYSSALIDKDGTIFVGSQRGLHAIIGTTVGVGLASSPWPMLAKGPSHSGRASTFVANDMPIVSIDFPASDSVLAEGSMTNLIGTAMDTEDGDIGAAITWSSDIDGVLGEGSSVSVSLATGSHTITASVLDSSGGSHYDAIALTVYDPSIDTDFDGMPDGWEAFYGLTDPADDGDGDNVGNLREYRIGSNPTGGDVVNGDINADDDVDARDVLLLEKYLLGTSTLNAQDAARADLYPPIAGDGMLTVSDLLLLQKQVMGGAQ